MSLFVQHLTTLFPKVTDQMKLVETMADVVQGHIDVKGGIEINGPQGCAKTVFNTLLTKAGYPPHENQPPILKLDVDDESVKDVPVLFYQKLYEQLNNGGYEFQIESLKKVVKRLVQGQPVGDVGEIVQRADRLLNKVNNDE